MRALAGIVPVIPTPFAEDESIDERSLRTVVEWVAHTGLGGLCLPAEFYKLTEAAQAPVRGCGRDQRRASRSSLKPTTARPASPASWRARIRV